MAWRGKRMIVVVTLLVAMQCVSSKPVNRQPPTPSPSPSDANGSQDADTGLEYDRYLKQVVEVLESDDEFRKKLETANISDIKSGAIAMHLELVNRTVRTKLDEIKRMEIMRLQQLARLKSRAAGGGKVDRMEIPGHLDLINPHSFEIKDLEHLILKTTKDLEEVDEQRRQDFKQYEMEKEYEFQQKLKDLPEDEKQKVLKQHEELQQKHKEHEKIQHPGSKDQFEEVWEKDDKMEDQDFNPRTFFMMHDLNQDMYWDIQEVEAVLQRELEKVYDARNSPEEDDPVEREEEMNRMREHVFTEIDQDKDLMISIQEFLHYTGKQGDEKKFEENEGWETVDEKPAFTVEEYQEYLRQHHAQPGVVPAPVDNNLSFEPEGQLNQQYQQQQQVGQQGMPQAVPAQDVQEPEHDAQGGGAEHLVAEEGEQQQEQQQEAQPPQDTVGQQAKPQEAHHPPQNQQAGVVDPGQHIEGQGQPGQPNQGQGQPESEQEQPAAA
ncbi:nucleobindin-2-like isoform X2 [Babylonia areolata]